MLLSASLLLLLVVCVQSHVHPLKRDVDHNSAAAAASRSTAKPALFIFKSPDKTKHQEQSEPNLTSTKAGTSKPSLLRALRPVDEARVGRRSDGANAELKRFGSRNPSRNSGNSYQTHGQNYSPAMPVSTQKLRETVSNKADDRKKLSENGNLSADYFEQDYNFEEYLQTEALVDGTTGMNAMTGKDIMQRAAQTEAQGMTTKMAVTQGMGGPQQGYHPGAQTDEPTELEEERVRQPVYGQSDFHSETKRGNEPQDKTNEDDDEDAPVFNGSPAANPEFKLDKDLEMEALSTVYAEANPSMPIPIQTRSRDCSLPEVLGGDEELPWTCRQRQKWRHLGENVYPSRLWETVCEGRMCYYNHYNCTPISYTLHVLKACDHGCQDQRVPSPLRSRWQWYTLNITVGCQCVR